MASLVTDEELHQHLSALTETGLVKTVALSTSGDEAVASTIQVRLASGSQEIKDEVIRLLSSTGLPIDFHVDAAG